LQDFYYAVAVCSCLKNPFCIFALVLLWRLVLLVFTVQPIPANDSFGYDGAVVNYLHTGHYCNPSLRLIFPISGKQVYSTYPPVYQAVLLGWMKVFGTGVVSAIWFHFVLFAVTGFLVLVIIRKFFPAGVMGAFVPLLFFGFTFGDRPEDLAYVFAFSALWFLLHQVSAEKISWGAMFALTALLLLTLYTSVIVGAYFFGVGFLACAASWLKVRRLRLFLPYVMSALLFAVITAAIARYEPLWWAGFMESARQQSVMSSGFHLPDRLSLIKLGRSVPVFLLALALFPLLLAKRREAFSLLSASDNKNSAWLFLCAGIFFMGWILLVADLTLLAADYVGYAMFTQIILAAGLYALASKIWPERLTVLNIFIGVCVLLVSVRALGMSTWGVACAWKNSYWQTRTTLQTEFQPYTNSDSPVLASSAFLYAAADAGVKNLIHCDWYFDHAHWTNDADLNAFIRLKPAKVVVTQFDYYRSYASLLDRLRAQPVPVGIRVRDLAQVRPPDGIPSLQRVVQHISWAPVIVDLDWQQ
jgi:hypothetical protein